VCVGLSIYSIPSDNGLSIGGIIQAEKLRRMAAEEKERLGHVSKDRYVCVCHKGGCIKSPIACAYTFCMTTIIQILCN
jgi:hypothetical protein